VRCAGLVLAAGAGTRLGRPKAVVEVGGLRLVDRSVRIVRRAGAEPVFVVVGAVEVGDVAAIVVRNDEWRTGLASSLRTGLSAVSAYDVGATPVDAVVITLVDLVGLTAAAVRRVLSAADAGARIAVATFDGVRGHPVLIRRDDWAEAARAADGDSGARRFLAERGADVVEVPCADIASSVDIDTEADLAAATADEGGRSR